MPQLFFIRHGETVDNVARLYAGSRDSLLTNHGFNQATRLGQYFLDTGVTFTHIFSSHLTRAVKTAEQIQTAQNGPVVVQSPLITEQDFGSAEGKPFHEVDHCIDTLLVPFETQESLNDRVDMFLKEHLIPAMAISHPADSVIAVVSHGMTLSTLWSRLLQHLPPSSIRVSDEVVANHSMFVLENIRRWSNTCYLQLSMKRRSVADQGPEPSDAATKLATSAARTDATGEAPIESIPRYLHPPSSVDGHTDAKSQLRDFITTVDRVNSKEHLKNLIRTGGGVGSAKHDERQRGIASFFQTQSRTLNEPNGDL